MAGLYIHIPFCRSRCIYCGFYSTTALSWRQRYVDALCREMELRSPATELSPGRQRIETVYLGGGTPSQLSMSELRQLFLYINKVYEDEPVEVTMECNPDDVTGQFAEELRLLPVNRISMGAQTFNDERLHFLRRRHTAAQVRQAVSRLCDAGIRNISIDLMYGFPGETLDDWQHDIDAALSLGVEHISAYCLTIEEGTPLWRLKIKDERLEMPDEETERRMYDTLVDRLTAAGYEHYEISNFARPGYRSRHNSSYWHDIPYIGIGAAAHSYNGYSRSWNASDLRLYMEAVERGERPYEEELLDDDTRYNDRITTALRTNDGLDLSALSDKYRRYCLAEARRLLDGGLLTLDGERLRLTRQGLFVSDYVMSSLIYA